MFIVYVCYVACSILKLMSAKINIFHGVLGIQLHEGLNHLVGRSIDGHVCDMI